MFALRIDAMTMKEGNARLQAQRAATSASATNGCVGRNGARGCEDRNVSVYKERLRGPQRHVRARGRCSRPLVRVLCKHKEAA